MYFDIDDEFVEPVEPVDYYDEQATYGKPATYDGYDFYQCDPYHKPMTPNYPCQCPLMMDPVFRRCMKICIRQHMCGGYQDADKWDGFNDIKDPEEE